MIKDKKYGLSDVILVLSVVFLVWSVFFIVLNPNTHMDFYTVDIDVDINGKTNNNELFNDAKYAKISALDSRSFYLNRNYNYDCSATIIRDDGSSHLVQLKINDVDFNRDELLYSINKINTMKTVSILYTAIAYVFLALCNIVVVRFFLKKNNHPKTAVFFKNVLAIFNLFVGGFIIICAVSIFPVKIHILRPFSVFLSPEEIKTALVAELNFIPHVIIYVSNWIKTLCR